MRRDELSELAQLHITGCLDEIETARFERLLHEAPPALQAEIVALQAGIAEDQTLLPDVEPDRALLWRVVGAVLEAAASQERAEQERLAPIATIGSPARSGMKGQMQEEDIAEAAGAMAAATSDAALAPAVQDDAEREAWNALLAADRWRKSALVWRGACLAVAGALAAALAFNVWLAMSATQVSRLALERVTGDQLRAAVGPNLADFIGQGSIVRGMVGTSPAVNSSATVLLAPTLDSALVMWVDLAANRTYSLRVVSADGVEREAGTFEVRSDVGGARIDLSGMAVTPASRWQVVDDRGVVLLRD
ncbi:MAG: hypothetical protein FGM37_03105 [Phycisphaerales bacterium]|nr:hypothetical protein [Phycisphaerales bacterium]